MKAATRYGPSGPQACSRPAQAGFPVELRIGAETIDVWVDERGIHFRQEGATCASTLPWGQAIAMSLVPRELPRMPTVWA